MKENENKEPSSTAGAAKGGNTSKESVGSPVSTAVGEAVATDDLLTDERIAELAEREADEMDHGYIFNKDGRFSVISFARAIEREAVVAYRERSLAAPTQVSAPQAVPEVLLNAKAVYDELYKTSSCSSLEEVSDVLDAIVRLIRADAPQASAAQEVRAVPDGMQTDLEQIAQSWDGCMVDAVGETMDVGATLRLQFKQLSTSTSTSTAPAAMDEKGGAK